TPRYYARYFFFAVREPDELLEVRFLPDDDRADDFRAGTLAPFFLASESPIAIACLRLFTVPPWPDLPLLSVPFFRRRIALSTVLLAPSLYLRRVVRLRAPMRMPPRRVAGRRATTSARQGGK